MFLKQNPLQKVFHSWKVILVVSILMGILSALVSFLVMEKQYASDAQVLIISKSRYGVDPYTSVKSSERVGENLLQVIKTDDFYGKVLDATTKFDTSKFENLSDRQRRKAWEKSVDVAVRYGTGVVDIRSYHASPQEANNMAQAIMETLVSKGWEYVGGDVTLKIINKPVATRFAAKPNMVVNGAIGFVVGAFLMVFSLLYRQKHT
ncbi:hypothetical protein H6758_02160 [Candidatus Nomurabacteria bacterium]|nr:hypothetical protein [Candidatus Nomurabacteria bacterium]